jgi:hypothetical protein
VRDENSPEQEFVFSLEPMPIEKNIDVRCITFNLYGGADNKK